MNLPPKTFTTLIQHTPLVSIDLIIYNPSHQILLGKRRNRPAQGYWFIPGGRIFKDETQAQAFQRISQAEIGLTLNIQDSELIGSFDHIYPDNVFGTDFSTHYVALGRKLYLASAQIQLPKEQHDSYCWLTEEALLNHPDVHPNVKLYFQ